MEFESGVTAVFTVSAFSLENNRTIKLMGSRGEVGGCLETGEILVKRFSDMSERRIKIDHGTSKHAGGDAGLMEHFAYAVENADSIKEKVDRWMFESHKIAFAAERARVKNIRIKM